MASVKRAVRFTASRCIYLLVGTLLVPTVAYAPPIYPLAAHAATPREENAPRVYFSSVSRSEFVAGGRRFPVRSLLNIRKKMRFGDFVWNDADVPDGPAWTLIDLSLQTISVFRGGHEIGTAVILYGSDHTPTPTGLFPIIERARRHRSTLYDADMNYMLRLTMDGVAIHASSVREGYATHGCIGLPEAFAEHVFTAMRTGDLVAIRQHGPGRS